MAAMPVSEIAKALFGDLVDAEVLMAKMDPGVSDVHSMGESNRAVLIPRPTGRRKARVRKLGDNTKRGLAITGTAATGVGGVLGLRELGESANELGHGSILRATKTGTKLIPRGVRTALKNPKVRLGAVGGMLAGDAIATGEQLRAIKHPRENVEKVAMGELVRGIVSSSRRASQTYAPQHAAGVARHAGVRKPLVGYGPKHAAPKAPKGAAPAAPSPAPAAAKPQPGARGMAVGQGIRGDIGRFAGTTTGKVVIGAAGAAGATHLVGRRRAAQSSAYDPYVGKRYVGKRDEVEFAGEFSKFDEDRRLAFGWANVSKLNGLPVVDRQGDYVSIEDIEDAAYTYVENSRVGGDMHKRIGGKFDGAGDRPHHVADLVESMVFDDAKCDSLGLPEDFPRGWWVGFRVFDDEVWDMAKDGRRAGFSIHGKGIRKSVSYDEIMGS